MNPKHSRHREHPPIRSEVSLSCGGRTADMRPAGRGGDLFNLCSIFGFLMEERGGVVTGRKGD